LLTRRSSRAPSSNWEKGEEGKRRERERGKGREKKGVGRERNKKKEGRGRSRGEKGAYAPANFR